MDAELDKFKMPALAAVSEPGFNIHIIREIPEDEQKKYQQFAKIAAEARNRFKLFAILNKNYSEWWNYTRSLLSPSGDLVEEEMLELDRLLLNFLSSTKSVLDHFRQHWIQAYRGTPQETEFPSFIEKIEAQSWAFSFFQDLRNFTQHFGLPVGNYTRFANSSSVTLKIDADAAWLVEKYKKWEKSGLTADRGKLSLIDLCREYVVRLQQDFGSFVAQAFAPNLLEAHNYLASLAKEVADYNPQATYKIITQLSRTETGLSIQFSTPPTDLLGYLGITVKQANQPPA